MSFSLIDNIPFALDLDSLLRTLHVRPGSDDAMSVAQLAAAAQAVARPKALCYVCAVERHAADCVVLDGVALTSRVLRVNLDTTHRVFVFVATCGIELEQWSAATDGLLERFWADAIKELALATAIDALRAHIDTRYQPGQLAMMNPGSLEDWPLSEQRALFAVLAGRTDDIGVQLSDSLLMHPVKSVSGLLYATADTFESCQLCPMDRCPNRRAPYDPALYEQKYRATA